MQEELVSNLVLPFPDRETDFDVLDRNILFQQDGAPPHFAWPVREYLDAVFPDRYIDSSGITTKLTPLPHHDNARQHIYLVSLQQI